MILPTFITMLLACGDAESETTKTEAAEVEEKSTTEANATSESDEETKVARKGLVAAPDDVAAPPADAITTATGLADKVLSKGTAGEKPTTDSKVTVHYTGWTTDGKMFDSSVMRGRPATFGLTQVIAGWTEGVQLMVTGEKTRFWIPENLAYKGRPGAPAGMLVFDVELLEIK